MVADDHCVRRTKPGVAFTVTLLSPAIVTEPVPVANISIDAPIGQAKAESVGIVSVTGVDEFISTIESW
jgi:hypothetical protein